MRTWLIRGLCLALLHAVLETGRSYIAAHQPASSPSLWMSITLAVLVGAAALWGALDGWRRLDGRGFVWFYAGLVAGPVAGALSVIGKAALVDQSGISDLGAALTSGAAFTALLVIIPAWLGVLVGGRLEPLRKAVVPAAAPAEFTEDFAEDDAEEESYGRHSRRHTGRAR